MSAGIGGSDEIRAERGSAPNEENNGRPSGAEEGSDVEGSAPVDGDATCRDGKISLVAVP